MNYETIHEAAKQGDLADVKRHLQMDEDANTRDNDGWTPLMLAAYNGHLDVVKFLVATGVDINTSAKDGWTPLMWAESNGKRDVADFLKQPVSEIKTKKGLAIASLVLGILGSSLSILFSIGAVICGHSQGPGGRAQAGGENHGHP